MFLSLWLPTAEFTQVSSLFQLASLTIWKTLAIGLDFGMPGSSVSSLGSSYLKLCPSLQHMSTHGLQFAPEDSQAENLEPLGFTVSPTRHSRLAGQRTTTTMVPLTREEDDGSGVQEVQCRGARGTV